MRKRVLVTGSSRGIGREIAMALADEGYLITCHGRSNSSYLQDTLSNLNRLSSEKDIEHGSLIFDVSDRALCFKVLEEDIQKFGAYYGVVLSAGITKDGPFPGMKDEDWDEILNVDLGGFYNVLRPLIMPMIQLRQGGRIVPIASISGITGNRGQVNYSAAKAGLIGASKALSKELAKRRITVNCVAPGGVSTDMVSDKLRDEMLKMVPMGRLAEPREVAGAVTYLFSEVSEYMTGQVLVLNGGMF